MEKLNLLIADADEAFRTALSKALSDSYCVHYCQNGKDALAYIFQQRPDIIVLDLMISELDGISLLYHLSKDDYQPIVLATTRLLNDYIIETAAALNVGYLMVKPCDAEAAADRVRDLSKRLSQKHTETLSPSDLVNSMLISLGIPSRLRGYVFLKDAILLMIQSPGQSITKELYPSVGDAHNSTVFQVERSIRSAIAAAWEQKNEEIWRKHFSVGPDGHVPRQSNGAFIARLADEIRMHPSDFQAEYKSAIFKEC